MTMTNGYHCPQFARALVAAGALAVVAAVSPGVAAAAEGGRSAVIVLLGDAGDSPELAAVLSELLQRQDVGVRFVRQEKLDTGELLSGKDDWAVRVFLELRGPREAALYFRGPRARRYLLRRLELREGLDEVGRELVAQVVASSVDSLLRSSEGMTRSEMRVALARDCAAPPLAAAAPPADDAAPAKSPPPNGASADKPSSAVPAPVPPAPSAPSLSSDAKLAPSAPGTTTVAATSRQADRGGARWSAWVGARYTYSWGGPDLGPGHGPGVELGVQRHGVTQLGARVSRRALVHAGGADDERRHRRAELADLPAAGHRPGGGGHAEPLAWRRRRRGHHARHAGHGLRSGRGGDRAAAERIPDRARRAALRDWRRDLAAGGGAAGRCLDLRHALRRRARRNDRTGRNALARPSRRRRHPGPAPTWGEK